MRGGGRRPPRSVLVLTFAAAWERGGVLHFIFYCPRRGPPEPGHAVPLSLATLSRRAGKLPAVGREGHDLYRPPRRGQAGRRSCRPCRICIEVRGPRSTPQQRSPPAPRRSSSYATRSNSVGRACARRSSRRRPRLPCALAPPPNYLCWQRPAVPRSVHCCGHPAGRGRIPPRARLWGASVHGQRQTRQRLAGWYDQQSRVGLRWVWSARARGEGTNHIRRALDVRRLEGGEEEAATTVVVRSASIMPVYRCLRRKRRRGVASGPVLGGDGVELRNDGWQAGAAQKGECRVAGELLRQLTTAGQERHNTIRASLQDLRHPR